MNISKPIISTPRGLIDFTTPKIMGVINVTDDSFYKASRMTSIENIVNKVGEMIDEGADIIDLGASSTRPGASVHSPEDELKRLRPALVSLRQNFPDVLISIDTVYSSVIRELVDPGFDMINDISAGRWDEAFLETVAQLGLPYILMHMRGTPESMQQKIDYDDLVLEILRFFADKLRHLRRLGIKDVLIDPGFGFAKTVDQNFQLLKQLPSFRIFNLPLAVGVSRKSFIHKSLGTSPDNALNGTSVAHTLALNGGANLLRVHDVAEAVQCVKLWGKYQYS